MTHGVHPTFHTFTSVTLFLAKIEESILLPSISVVSMFVKISFVEAVLSEVVCAVLSVCSVVAVSCPAVVEEVLPVVFPVCPHPAKRSAPVSKSVAIDNVLFFIIRKSPLFFVVQTIV